MDSLFLDSNKTECEADIIAAELLAHKGHDVNFDAVRNDFLK